MAAVNTAVRNCMDSSRTKQTDLSDLDYDKDLHGGRDKNDRDRNNKKDCDKKDCSKKT